MKKTLVSVMFAALLIAPQANAEAEVEESFSSDCELVMTQPSEFVYHLDIVNKNTNEQDELCRVVTYRVENYEESTAEIAEMTEYSLDISISAGDNFTVYVEKDGGAISKYFDIPGETDPTNCTNSVIDNGEKYSIELLGEDGKRDAECRFSKYDYEILSGDAQLVGMNEYTLFFDSTIGGIVKVTVESPTEYWATFNIGNNNETNEESATHATNKVPPAGYEDEVLTSIIEYENPFPDTNIEELEGMAAAELYRRAILGGYPDGEFKGSREVNRAETSKFLLYARYGKVEEQNNNGRFADVLDNQWYTKFIVEAANKEIINGYDDGLFRPEKTVNTAEFTKMLSLTFDLEENLSSNYEDVTENDWFSKYAGIATKYELFPGREMKLLPSQTLSREDVAIAIYQYLSNRE